MKEVLELEAWSAMICDSIIVVQGMDGRQPTNQADLAGTTPPDSAAAHFQYPASAAAPTGCSQSSQNLVYIPRPALAGPLQS